NADTVDRVLSTLREHGHKVADGERLGKTIVFAKNQPHAEFILQRFDAQWPELGGRYAQIITHASRYPDALLDDFKTPGKAPHIAISVDMLDTGVDVPDVVNLVFFKLIRSKTKFWQMIGRGTRLRPDLYGPGRDKEDFLVFDWCQNLEFFNQDLPESDG
ncbi:restriction endonuclease subunit R, partial [Xanthomonas citri pv. citri]|nr:restriction endonuclease subunit R [Xanthomonas citri pv. citri]